LVLSLAGFFGDIAKEVGVGILSAFTVSVVGMSLAPLYLGSPIGLSEAFAKAFQLICGWLSTRVSFRRWLVAGGYFIESFLWHA